MKFTERLQQLSNEYILGGVNSASRSYKAVGGGAPVVMREGHGAYCMMLMAINLLITSIWSIIWVMLTLI